MIQKLLAASKKEMLILLRDRVGLAILFLMPMILVFVMTLVQDSAFKTLNEKGIPVVFVDEDKDSLGVTVRNGLFLSELCTITDNINGKPYTIAQAKQAVSEGKFLVGIIIPKGATQAIRDNVSLLVEDALASDTLTTLQTSKKDSVEIIIFIDPITKKSFISSVTSSLREFISGIKTQIMFKTFSEKIAELMPEKKEHTSAAYNHTQIIKYKEIYASKQIGEIVPNAVQHNVPAWAIFAMFFIVLPLAGSMVKEKQQGSILRLNSMPASFLYFINGKMVVYVIVCLVQFILMMCVGLYILPLLGLPKLIIGNSVLGMVLITLATALAACGFGIMMGTISKTEQQGAIMGALSILLLSAIGGIWVPTYVMPETMRNIGAFSPLNWSLNGFYELFLRGGGGASVVKESIKLILFFLFTMSVASIVNRMKRNV